MAEAACAGGEFVAGPYAGKIRFPGENELDLGQTDGGFEIEMDYSVDNIVTDEGGDIVRGGIYRGGNCYINMTLMQFNSEGTQRLLRPFSNVEGKVGVIGCEVGTQAAVLTLTQDTGLAMTNQPTSYHFGIIDGSNNNLGGVVVDDDVPLRWALSSRLRVLPIRLRCLVWNNPNDNNTAYWYSTVPPNPSA